MVEVNIKQGDKTFSNPSGKVLEIITKHQKKERPISTIGAEIHCADENYRKYRDRTQQFKEVRDKLKQVKKQHKEG